MKVRLCSLAIEADGLVNAKVCVGESLITEVYVQLPQEKAKELSDLLAPGLEAEVARRLTGE